MYMLITVLRSIRSDYAAEIWSGLLGKEVQTPPQVFTSSEMVVALTVMLANGLCFLIKDNRRAFFVALAIGGCGTALVAAGVAGLHYGLLDGFAFMVLVGIGLYLPYVAIHTTIFERLIAMTRDRGNLGYLMYLADAFGYLGYPIFMTACRPLFGRTDAVTSLLGNLPDHGDAFLGMHPHVCGVFPKRGHHDAPRRRVAGRRVANGLCGTPGAGLGRL